MITVSDLIHLPYAPDLTTGGITYACRSLAHTYNRMGGDSTARLQRIVAGVAVELAFRRRLAEEEVPYDLLGATHFTAPDRYDIALGGRRCDLKSFLLSNKQKITNLQRNPEALLDALALVPVDQYQSENLREEDLYIFCFLIGSTAQGGARLKQAIQAGRPAFLIHTLPKAWVRPQHWQSLGALVLKTGLAAPLEVEIGGQDGSRTFQVENLLLPPRVRVLAGSGFFALHYLRASRLPEGPVGVHSPVLRETYVVEPGAWGNIWLYGLEIVLAGYITRGEFRRRVSRLPPGSPVLQYAFTRTENMSLPVRELHPLGDLFARAKRWGTHSSFG